MTPIPRKMSTRQKHFISRRGKEVKKAEILFLVLIIAFLALMTMACSKGDSNPVGPSGSAYGTLTLSGSGSSITGTQVTPTNSSVVDAVMPVGGKSYSWFIDRNKRPTWALWVQCRTSYSDCLVLFDYFPTPNNFFLWGAGDVAGSAELISPPGLTVGTSYITFDNVTLRAWTSSTGTATSLTLNGTLRF